MKLFVFICVLGLISSIYSKPKREEQNAEEEVTRSYDIGGNAEAEAIRSNDARENAEEEVTRSYDIGGNAEEEAIRSNDAGESKRAFGWYDKSPFSYNNWPKCRRFGEYAWRPCVDCCPLGYECTKAIYYDNIFPYPYATFTPIFPWRKWCCETEPCCNVV